MAESKIRVYADTSVYGGVFDREFARPSMLFFDGVRKGRFALVTSEIVRDEIRPAPPSVQGQFAEMLPYADLVEMTGETIDLYRAYMAEGIVTAGSDTDAIHVAIATVSRCSLLVSWNCHHIVHFQKIPRYNAVSVLKGFPPIEIYTPLEVVGYEKKILRLRGDEA